MTNSNPHKKLRPRNERTIDDRLRRAAARQGLVLSRSATRDPLALTYGLYAISPADRRKKRAPASAYTLTLAEAENILTGKAPRP